jgi:hypothetical protein
MPTLKPNRVNNGPTSSNDGVNNADMNANPSLLQSLRNMFSGRGASRGGPGSKRGQPGVEGESPGDANQGTSAQVVDRELTASDAIRQAAPNPNNRFVKAEAEGESTTQPGKSVTTGQNLDKGLGDPNNEFDYRPRNNEDPNDHKRRVKDHIAKRYGKRTDADSSGIGTGTKILILGGISAGIVFAILAARYNNTNSSVNIETIRIEDYNPQVSGYKKVTVAYDRSGTITRRGPPTSTLLPTDKNSFNPCRGDIVKIANSPMNDTVEYRVMDAGTDTVILKIPDSDLDIFTTFTPASGKNSWDGSRLPYTYNKGDDGTSNELLNVYTDFGNQMADMLDGGLDILLDIAETVIDQVVNRALPYLGGAAKSGFCAMVPILCDSTIWIIIGLLIAGLIVFIVVS